jgi:hypothetical protein
VCHDVNAVEMGDVDTETVDYLVYVGFSLLIAGVLLIAAQIILAFLTL